MSLPQCFREMLPAPPIPFQYAFAIWDVTNSLGKWTQGAAPVFLLLEFVSTGNCCDLFLHLFLLVFTLPLVFTLQRPPNACMLKYTCFLNLHCTGHVQWKVAWFRRTRQSLLPTDEWATGHSKKNKATGVPAQCKLQLARFVVFTNEQYHIQQIIFFK